MDELLKKREALDAEIARARAGEAPLLDDTAVKDRFQQFQQLARELLADFREVEHNFRLLDRKVREKIVRWEGSKGALLDEIMGARDAIGNSDQGRSFAAFWGFLMSSQRQEAFTALLEQALALPAVAQFSPDQRLRHVHYDWLEAGEHTQRTVALLSQQLRRFLDDKAFLENRRIIELLRNIEGKALALRENMPKGVVMEIDAMGADIELPMERPLFAPSVALRLADAPLEAGDGEVDTARLFSQSVVDKARLRAAIRRALRGQSHITLHELVQGEPLQHGLAELVAYLELAHADAAPGGVRAVVDEGVAEPIRWQACDAAGQAVVREARLPRVIFTR